MAATLMTGPRLASGVTMPTIRASWPPADAPVTTRRFRSTLYLSAWSTNHLAALSESITAAGASAGDWPVLETRYSTLQTTNPWLRYGRQRAFMVDSLLLSIHPPPWKTTTPGRLVALAAPATG